MLHIRSTSLRNALLLAFAAGLLAAGCKGKAPLTNNLKAENKVSVRPLAVYFQSAAMLLAPEHRSVELPENAGAALPIAMRELLKGPRTNTVARALPADTILRGAFLLPDGTAIVDLGGITVTRGWNTGTHEELIATYSIVQTITANFPDAKRVRILVNGEPPETLAGHISMAKALVSDATMLDPARK
jgi:spore germination protein GerM